MSRGCAGHADADSAVDIYRTYHVQSDCRRCRADADIATVCVPYLVRGQRPSGKEIQVIVADSRPDVRLLGRAPPDRCLTTFGVLKEPVLEQLFSLTITEGSTEPPTATAVPLALEYVQRPGRIDVPMPILLVKFAGPCTSSLFARTAVPMPTSPLRTMVCGGSGPC